MPAMDNAHALIVGIAAYTHVAGPRRPSATTPGISGTSWRIRGAAATLQATSRCCSTSRPPARASSPP